MTALSRTHFAAAALSFAVLLGTPSARAESGRTEFKARLQNIEQYLDDWNVSGARQELNALLAENANRDLEPLRYFQGRVAFEEGRYQEAVEHLEAAGVSDRAGSYLRLAKDTQRLTANNEQAESAHFIFSYPKGKDAVLVPYALEALEAIRAALLEDLGHAPTGKVRVEVVSNASELSKVSTLTLDQIRTTGTIAICKFNKLMVTSPKAVVHGYDWLDTLAHEYVHLVVSQSSNNTVPIWLHEGLAKYLESRWRGPPGGAMTPSTLALLGSRVKSNSLIPFEKMHPSIALLPTAEDAATAFAEVFFAIDLIHREKGTQALRTILAQLREGKTDRRAVEAATAKPFPTFEKAWLAHVRKQPFPSGLIPRSPDEKKQLKAEAGGKGKDAKKQSRDISYGDFGEIAEADARKRAHLGELMRERRRLGAAAEQYAQAYTQVGNRYESLSNKYALALLELKRFDEAERVLKSSLEMHPGSAATHVHLGRIYLRSKNWSAARDSYLSALATDPFDPEVHVALVRAHEALGEKEKEQRARKATRVLTGLEGEELTRAIRALAREENNLADVSVPAKDEAPTPTR